MLFLANAKKYLSTMHKNKNKVKENNKHLIKIKIKQILTGMIMKSYKLQCLKVWKRKIRI